MKNSTRILGIFLALILIIGLVMLFVAKAYIDSKDTSFKFFPYNNYSFYRNIDNLKSAANFQVNTNDLNNLNEIEDQFFQKADQFITSSTNFSIKEKEELNIDNIDKNFTISTNLTKAVLIFSDKEKPKVSYKFYTKISGINNPVVFNNDKLGFLEDLNKRSYTINDEIYLFAFIVLPTKYQDLKFESNATSIQIAADKIDISNLFEVDMNAADVNIKILSLTSNNLKLDASASSSKIETEKIIANDSFSYKLNASKSNIDAKIIKTKNLSLDLNASESIINATQLDISSSINIKENAGNYKILSGNFINYPTSFNYKSNMTNSVFQVKNCPNFLVKSKTNAASVNVRYNGQTHKFSGDFELNSDKNKIDEKNLLKVNLDVNMGNIEFIFE